MRVLVAIKRVPDPNQRVRVNAAGTGIDPAGLRWVINPYDEVALEQAIQWKEAGVVTEIIAASAGGPGCKDTLRSALALGADRAVHVPASDDVAPLSIARALADLARRESCDLAVVGAQAADDGVTIGPLVAGLLDWPQATRVTAATIAGRLVSVQRVGDAGVEALDLDIPCVLTADLRLATPRFAGLAAVLAAKKASIEERPLAAAATAPRVLAMALVSRQREGRPVASARELVAALRARGALP